MRLLSQYFPEFAGKLDEIDNMYQEKRLIDERTYQFICLALSIKNRSAPCVKKHFKGALEAGATLKEISYIMALTFRESAGSDDCWVHDVLNDYKEIIKKNIKCCEK
jgi:AhpD family alkylhydroperoxidase